MTHQVVGMLDDVDQRPCRHATDVHGKERPGGQTVDEGWVRPMALETF